jgi:hypothetical protein
MALSSGGNQEGAWGSMLFRARFLTRPDLDSDDFELREGLTLGGEIDFPQEGTRWRLVGIVSCPGDELPMLTFEQLSAQQSPNMARPPKDDDATRNPRPEDKTQRVKKGTKIGLLQKDEVMAVVRKIVRPR